MVSAQGLPAQRLASAGGRRLKSARGCRATAVPKSEQRYDLFDIRDKLRHNGETHMSVLDHFRILTTSKEDTASYFQALGLGRGKRFASARTGGRSERSIVAVVPSTECSRNTRKSNRGALEHLIEISARPWHSAVLLWPGLRFHRPPCRNRIHGGAFSG